MYRIEVSPGEITVFRTIEELAISIRNGLVTPRSRIYHHASQKWLPVEFHPHYKKALQSLDRPKPVTPLPSAAARSPIPIPPSAAIPPRPISAPVRPVTPMVPAEAADLPYVEVELPPVRQPEPAPIPRLERTPTLPVARRRNGGSRPLFYAGAAVSLVVVGYLVTTSVPTANVAATPAPTVEESAPRQEDEREAPAPAAPQPEPDPAPVPAPTPAPAREAAPPSAITSVPPRSGPPSQAWSSSAGATTPSPTRTLPGASPATEPPAPAITPPPAAVDLAVPALPSGDSLAPSVRSPRDTAAIKRILKAVSR